MKFGRNAQKPARQSSGLFAKAFFALIVFASLAVAYVLITPAEQLSAWLTENRIALPWSQTTGFEHRRSPSAKKLSGDNEVDAVSVPEESLNFDLPPLPPVSFSNLMELGSENYLFDPVKRSKRLALIQTIAAKDRAHNMRAPNTAMNAAIEKINRLISKEQNNPKPDNDNSDGKPNRLAQYRFHAESIIDKFNSQAEMIDREIARETNRRELIVRGLKEVK